MRAALVFWGFGGKRLREGDKEIPKGQVLSDQKKVLLFRKVSEIKNLSSIHEDVPLGPNWGGTCSCLVLV